MDVQVKGLTVDIRVRQVPLQQVLDQISAKTGMKIVYDTEPPQDQVTLELHALAFPAAVNEVLRGHGLTYALVMDATGQRVDKLLLTHGGGGAAHNAPPPQPMPQPPEGEQQEYYEEPQEYPEPPPPPETPPATPPPAVWTPAPINGQIPGLSNIGVNTPPPTPMPQAPPSSVEGQPPPQQPGQPPPQG
jgi:hypothetical protein